VKLSAEKKYDNMLSWKHDSPAVIAWYRYHIIITGLSCYHDNVIILSWQDYHVIMITYHIF
jgi:hypothetical protein